MRNVLFLLLFSLSLNEAVSQVSLGNGNHVIELSGSVSAYYNARFLKPEETDRKKNMFVLRDAQIQLEGRYKNLVAYEIQFDLADIASADNGNADAENPGILDAFVMIRAVPHLDITAGYAKVPYGRSSQTPFIYSPYWQRAELLRGGLFSRRDVGLTLSTSLWKQRILAYAGIYSGMGEISLRGENDPSGSPEFIGRLEVAYPSRFRHRDVDTRHTPIPMVVAGVNARYTDRTQPAGSVLPAFAAGEYGLKTIDGRKLTYGIDVAFQYMGFSAQFEMHRMRLQPTSPAHVLFQGIAAEKHKGYVLAGGYVAQLNYHIKPIDLTTSVRFEELNLNDLAIGLYRAGSAALSYTVAKVKTTVKVQYIHVFEEEESINRLKWNDQLRIGIVYVFK